MRRCVRKSYEGDGHGFETDLVNDELVFDDFFFEHMHEGVAVVDHRDLDLRRVAPPLAVAAVAMSFGLHYVFTNLLVIDLP